jgi:hypothetical protein
MRATRAYIAGFGTAGSLLAGAAMVFVLASAVVAFRGWPQVGTTSAPASVVIGRPHIAAASPVHLRLVAATGGARSAVAPAAGASGQTARSGTPGRSDERIKLSSSSSARLAMPPVAVVPPAAKPPVTTPACGAACDQPSLPGTISTVLQNTTGAVGNTVAEAGQSLGSTVSGLTNAVATKLAPLSPGLSKAVSNVGSTVSGVVGNTATAAGQAVNGLGHTLSNVLGALGGH